MRYITEFFNITEVDGMRITVKTKSGEVKRFRVDYNSLLVDASGITYWEWCPLIVGGLYRASVIAYPNNPNNDDGLITSMQSTKFKQKAKSK